MQKKAEPESQLSVYQEYWLKQQKQKPLKAENNQHFSEVNQQIQSGQKFLPNQDNQQTYVIQQLFEQLGFDNICIEIDPHDKEYEELFDILSEKAQKKDLIMGEKRKQTSDIKERYEAEIKNLDTVYSRNKEDLEKAFKNLDQLSRSTKQNMELKLQTQLETENEKERLENESKEVADKINGIAKDWTDIVYDLITECKEKNPHESKKMVDDFFEKVECNDVAYILDNLQKLEQLVLGMRNTLQQNIGDQLRNKTNKSYDFLRQIKQKLYNFTSNINGYYETKGKEAIKHYNLPPYESQLDSQVSLRCMNAMISFNELQRLKRTELINDQIMEVYSLYLKQMNQYQKKEDDGQIFFITQLFFDLVYNGYSIKNVDATNFLNDYCKINDMFDPKFVDRVGFILNVDAHSSRHWIFLGVYNKTREIMFYDSLDSNQHYQNVTSAMSKYIGEITQVQYTSKRCPNQPKQQNGYDCGMFVLKFMQNFAYDQGEAKHFDQNNINSMRRKLYTFFPLLAYQNEMQIFDFDTLQYFEDRFETDYSGKIRNKMISFSK